MGLNLITFENNRSLVREHPLKNPETHPLPIQGHAFIFPGDELLYYHFFNLPADCGASSMSGVKILSAKASIIAVKFGVFNETFNETFNSTRTFELESFTTAFDNSNAKYIPWNSGADGYVQNLTFQQDKTYKLPPGDFLRRIKFFTQHTNGTGTWTHHFYWPVIFRWEYWQELLTAHNDFFDSGQPKNGQNHWWYHYFVAGKWFLYARMELKVLVGGVEKTLQSNRLITFLPNSVNDYNSNTDWTNKSIKTCDIGGTPSNAPCFIYANKDTEVHAFFEKVSGWGSPTQQENISLVIWIEPRFGAGVTARTRASSKYPALSETVFAGLTMSLTDDSGTGIQDSAGNFLVTSANGNGVVLLFNGAAKDFTGVSIIDKNKLSSIYAGTPNYRIYARLYNSTLGTTGTLLEQGNTLRGEEIYQDAILVNLPEENFLCERDTPACPFNLDVFADNLDSTANKNDNSDFYGAKYCGDQYTSAIQLTLEKAKDLCGDEWETKKIIIDGSLGQFFAYGKSPDFKNTDFVDDFGKKYTGLFLEWRKVLLAYGVGRYRMKIKRTDAFGNESVKYDERIFCLKPYTCDNADETVKIEYNTIGFRGTLEDNTLQIDHGAGWKSEIRLRGIFEYKKSGYVKEYTIYGDASFNKRAPVNNEQEPKYLLSIKPIPGYMDLVLGTNILQADDIFITDYNVINRHPNLNHVPVMNDGDYEPYDNQNGDVTTFVQISLAYGQNSLRKRNSQ